MKKTLKLSMIAALAMTASLSADIINEGTVSGNIQQQYRLSGGSDVNTQDAFTTAGNVKLETKKYDTFYGAVNFYGIGDMGLNGGNVSNAHLNHGSQFSILNEAYIGSSLKSLGVDGNAIIGRFQLNTNLVSSISNVRYDLPIPNSFEGLNVESKPIDGLTVAATWIKSMSGVHNDLDKTKFKSINDIAGNYDDSMEDKAGTGLYLLRASYDLDKNTVLSFENRYVDEFSNAFYQELSTNVPVKMPMNISNLKVSQQYIKADSQNELVNADVIGLKVSAAMDKFEGTVAYNHNNGLLSGFQYGSDPLFTSMNTANSYNDVDSRGIMVSGAYKICDEGTVKVAYANFKGNMNDSDTVEVTGTHSFMKNINVNAVAGYTQNNQNNSENASFRVLAAYKF